MSKKSLASSAAAMASGTLVSRFLGLVRAAMLAASIATVGGAANAFAVANKLPTIIYMLLAGGVLNAVLVPQIVRAMRESDGGHRYVNQLLTLGSLVLGGITVVLTAGANILLTLYAAKMSPEWKPLALTFAYICLPQLFFYGLYTLLGQVLNARGNFGPYMWAPALNNVVSIIGLGIYLFLFGQYQVGQVTPADWDSTRIWLVAGTATAGIASQALVLLIPLHRSGFRIIPVFQFRGSGLGRASKVAGWAFAALAVGQIGYLVISNLAVAAESVGAETGITVAANAAYDHAFTIFMLPQSLITVSLVTAMFTRLSHHAVSGDVYRVRDQLSMGLRTLAVFTTFATAALMVLAIPIVALILAGSPAYDAQQAIGHVVVAFALGLVPIGAWTMIQRVYFAYEDTKTLFRIQIPMMLIVVAFCGVAYLFFPPQWWVAVGAALGTTASNTFGTVVAYLGLRRRLPSLDGARVLRTHLRVTFAVIPAALFGWIILHFWGVQAGLFGSLVRVGVVGTLMGVVYLVLLKILGVAELDSLLLRVAGVIQPISGRIPNRIKEHPFTGSLRKLGSFFAPSDLKAGVVGNSWAPGDKIADRYRLIDRVDSQSTTGYTLTTWMAFDDILEKDIRVMIFGGDADRVANAIDGARRRAVLTDPTFPRIFRVIDAGEQGIVITEPVQGTPLIDLINDGELTSEQARSIIGEAATGLERVHRQGMQHLGLTPASIIVEDGGIKLIGLGIQSRLENAQMISSEHGARKDTVGLAQVLFAALSGLWMGPGDVGLKRIAQSVSSAQELHDHAPEAPLDLVRLCYLTVSPFEEGPHTPAEFASNLRPWQPLPSHEPATVVSEDFLTGGFTTVQITDPSQPVGHAEETTQLPIVSDTASGREDHGGWDLPPGADHTLTTKAGSSAPSHGEVSPVFASEAQWDFPEVDQPSSLSEPTGTTHVTDHPQEGKFTQLKNYVIEQFQPVGEGEDRRVNPAGFVLLAMIALIVFALVLATASLRSARNFDPDSLPPPDPVVTSPQEEEPPAGDDEGDEDESEEDEDEDSDDDAVDIVITDAETYDPSTGGGENQDLAHLAIDEDMDTIWRSMRYNSPTYAIKDGIAYSVILEEEVPIEEVIIHLQGEGGRVEVRATDPTTPTSGDALASATMSPTTTLTFEEPVETDTIVLWFPELPVAESDGMHRIELAEVELK